MKAPRYLRFGSLSLLCLLLLTASFTAGARFGPSVFGRLGLPELAAPIPVPFLETSSEPASVAPTFSVFWEAWNIVSQNFVDPKALDVSKMTYGAIRGMVDSLGDNGHTRFLDPSAFQSEQSQLRGDFSGIGAEINLKDGVPVIVAPIEGSPADKAGLKSGDRILRVNGEDVQHLSLTDLTTRVRGQPGTQVTLSIIRQGYQPGPGCDHYTGHHHQPPGEFNHSSRDEHR